MPFTPFHFGPGAALKAMIRSHFSFVIFCYSQVATDLESGFYLLRGEYPIHRFFHTYVGATIVGFFCAITGRPLCQLVLRACQGSSATRLVDRLIAPPKMQWSVAFTSSIIGTYSHVFLDSIMHRDIAPFNPFSAANPTLDLVSLSSLHALCLILGVAGVLLYWIGRRP